MPDINLPRSWSPPEIDLGTLIDGLRKAWLDGRSIVPVLGLGISAESGIPTLQSVVRYLARFSFFVENRAYLPVPRHLHGTNVVDLFAARASKYYARKHLFVEDQGWPDLFQLNQDLRNFLELCGMTGAPADLDTVEDHALERLARELYPDRYESLQDLHQSNSFSRRQLNPWDLRRNQAWQMLGQWNDLVWHLVEGDPNHADGLFEKFERGRRPGMSHRFLAFLAPLLNIRMFITTNFDTLLEQALDIEGIAYRAYQTGQGRLLPVAGLVSEMVAVVKFHGTTREGVWQDRASGAEPLNRLLEAMPPRPLLLVLGSSGGRIRILDLLRAVTQRNCRDGVNGPSVVWLHNELHLPRQVRRAIAIARGSTGVAEPSLGRSTELREGRPGGATTIKPCDRATPFQPDLLHARVVHPGLFLSHLYSNLTSRHPASRFPYASHVSRPIPRRSRLEDVRGSSRVSVNHDAERTFWLYSSFTRSARASSTDLPANEVLIRSLSEHYVEKTPLWVDLESHYTLAGVVGSIIDQCRNYDSQLAPSVLPLATAGDSETIELAIRKGVRRVEEALSRGRYLLVLDSFETYTWRHTVHHGNITMEPGRRAQLCNDLSHLTTFIEELTDRLKHQSGSALFVSINTPEPRRRSREGERGSGIEPEWRKTLAACGRRLAKLCNSSEEEQKALFPEEDTEEEPLELDKTMSDEAGNLLHGVLADHPKRPDWLSKDRARLALLCLCCFRRTRNLVALRTILRQLVEAPVQGDKRRGTVSAHPVDELLECYCEQGYLVPLEGGGYWMNRSLRDRYYDVNSCLTSDVLAKFAAGRGEGEKKLLCRATLQVLLLALHHDRIARYYYSDNFVLSGDPDSFFEYIYHRVSSIRYLTKLEHLKKSCHSQPEVWRTVADRLGMVFDELTTYLDIRHKREIESDGPGDITELLYSPTGGDLDLVERRRCNEIASLQRAFARSRATLQARVPAEQLISWCDWLLGDDLPRFLIAKQPEPGEMRNLRSDLYTLKARLCQERSDVRESIKTRLEQLIRLRGPAGWPQPPNASNQTSRPLPPVEPEAHASLLAEGSTSLILQAIDSGDVTPVKSLLHSRLQKSLSTEELEYWFDIAHALAVLVRERSFRRLVRHSERPEHENASEPTLDILLGLLNGIVEDKEISKRTPRSEDPLHLRLLELRAENILARLNYWKSDKHFFDSAKSAWHDTLVLARRGLLRVRRHEHGAEGFASGYLQWRGRFLLIRARASWLGYEDPPAESRNTAADADKDALVRHDFTEAYRYFELARGGSDPSDRVFLAQIDLFAAECALVHADTLLDRAFKSYSIACKVREGESAEEQRARLNQAEPGPELLEQVEPKFGSVASYLRRAQGHLLHGRRNVIWQLFAYQLQAQYESDRNLWRLAVLLRDGRNRIRDHDWFRSLVSDFLSGLRQGLLAVRRGLDLGLPSATQEGHEGHPWLMQVWHEFLLCGIAFGRLAYRIYQASQFNVPEQDDLPERTREFWSHLRWFMRSAGLHQLEPFHSWFAPGVEDYPKACHDHILPILDRTSERKPSFDMPAILELRDSILHTAQQWDQGVA